VRSQAPAELMRIRSLARIKPPGMETPVEVSELLPPATELPELSDQHLAAFESAVTALQQGNWAEALARLHHVPPDDLAKDFLTVFIAQHNRIPPPEWDGVVSIR
jgi:adenylate cyclase